MKKFLLILCLFVAGSWANAQTYTEKDFQQSVLQINTAKTTSDYDHLFQKFSELTSTKTTERWQAYYYAAVSMYLKTEVQLNQTTREDLSASNSLAEKFVNAALTAQPDNAEINTLVGLIFFQKTQINAASDTKKYLDVISKSITKAEATAPNSPRLAILKARIKEKSGDKAGAIVLFKNATSTLSKNSTSTAVPTWGSQLIQLNK